MVLPHFNPVFKVHANFTNGSQKSVSKCVRFALAVPLLD